MVSTSIVVYYYYGFSKSQKRTWTMCWRRKAAPLYSMHTRHDPYFCVFSLCFIFGILSYSLEQCWHTHAHITSTLICICTILVWALLTATTPAKYIYSRKARGNDDCFFFLSLSLCVCVFYRLHVYVHVLMHLLNSHSDKTTQKNEWKT